MARCYNSKLVFNKATTATLSSPMSIGHGELLRFQIDGTATSFSIKVTGSVASGMDYEPLQIINDLDNSYSSEVSSAGHYSCDVSGLFAVKFEIVSISGGALDLFAKSLSVIEIKKEGQGGGGAVNPYVLPVASGTTLGGIKVGSNLNITNDGTLSAVGGTGEGDKTYVFTQSFATTEWNIVHNLNKYPSVVVVDSDLNQVIADVKYIDLNTIKVKFSQSFTGKVFLN